MYVTNSIQFHVATHLHLSNIIIAIISTIPYLLLEVQQMVLELKKEGNTATLLQNFTSLLGYHVRPSETELSSLTTSSLPRQHKPKLA